MNILKNSIGWCDDTGNKVIGCEKVSPGCKNCYAEVGTIARVKRGLGIETWGPKGQRIPVADFSAKLRRLNKLCICDTCHETQPFARIGKECGCLPAHGTILEKTLADNECTGTLRRIRFFADSNSDWLDDKWPAETLAQFMEEIYKAPNVDVLLLTKRPELWRERMQAVLNLEPSLEDDFMKTWLVHRDGKPGWALALAFWIGIADGMKIEPYPNIWLGVSAENQALADLRRPLLEQIPAAVRFVSYEPALEPVNWAGWDFLSWMIAGLESGPKRRDGGIPCLEVAADWCQLRGVPIYIKQDCALKSGQQGRIRPALWKLKQFPQQA